MVDASEATLPRLLTVEQAAAVLGVGSRTVRRLIWRGDLPAVRPVPGSVRIDSRDLAAYIEQLRAGSP